MSTFLLSSTLSITGLYDNVTCKAQTQNECWILTPTNTRALKLTDHYQNIKWHVWESTGEMVLRIAAVLTSSDAMQDAHSIQRQKKNYGVNRLTSVQLKEIISVRITTKHCGIYRIIVIVVSGMQLLRLHSAIHRHQSSTEGGSQPNLLLRGA